MRRLQLVCPVRIRGPLTGTCRAMYPSGVCTEPSVQGAGKSASVLRFQEITGGILYGGDCAGCRRSCVCYAAFADRFPLENFVILDERRAAAGIHPAGKTWFLTKLSKQELDTLQQAGQQKDENEQEIEVLFQSFCRSLSILERQNQPPAATAYAVKVSDAHDGISEKIRQKHVEDTVSWRSRFQ